jgi:rare lipoprotein A
LGFNSRVIQRACLLALFFAGGCASVPQPAEEPTAQVAKPQSRGGYYKDDGPGDHPPPNLAEIPDAKPRLEALHRAANRPYVVFGRSYQPLVALQPYRQRGVASWYGRRFHGQKTSSGEVYDMYGMTAAHPTLPIPSYARVTHVANGRSVIVRINDRGPFHSERIIDLSYAAAYRLGYIASGSAEVEVESIQPEDSVETAAQAKAVYVQLGAFASRENAEDLRGRLARQLVWLSETVQVLASGNLWRLHVGPYGSNDAARSVAERIETELNLKPLLVVR